MSSAQAGVSIAATQLLKGPVYRDIHESVFTQLLASRNQVSDYLAVIGLVVVIDEAEGYAFIRTREVDGSDSDAPSIPRLVARRPLSFHVSLLLALLRKKLAEHDASSAEVRVVMSREQIVEMIRVFLPESTNDARLVDQIDTYINKVVELGFLRRMQGSTQQFELRRILKAYVDGQWLADFDARLSEYREQFNGDKDRQDEQ